MFYSIKDNLKISVWYNFLRDFSNLVVPLYMISLFSTLKYKKRGFVLSIICTGILAIITVILIIVGMLFTTDLIIESLETIGVDLSEQSDTITALVIDLSLPLLNVNVMVDLFICKLIFFFLTYLPKRIKVKGFIYFIRALVIIPILYVVLSSMLINDESNEAALFLTSRKIPVYLFFFSLIILEKYTKKKNTFNSYSNMEIFNNSLLICLLLLICSFIDLSFGFIPYMDKFGFGVSYKMFLCIPFVLLFNNKRNSRHPKFSIFFTIYYLILFIVILIIALGYLGTLLVSIQNAEMAILQS